MVSSTGRSRFARERGALKTSNTVQQAGSTSIKPIRIKLTQWTRGRPKSISHRHLLPKNIKRVSMVSNVARWSRPISTEKLIGKVLFKVVSLTIVNRAEVFSMF
jgi:hypothetical protein